MKLSGPERTGIARSIAATSGIHVAAIDRNCLPGDKIALGRGEEHQCSEQVLRRLISPQRAAGTDCTSRAFPSCMPSTARPLSPALRPRLKASQILRMSCHVHRTRRCASVASPITQASCKRQRAQRKLHISRLAARTRKVSGPKTFRNPMRIRPTFQLLFQNDVCEFESSQHSQGSPIHLPALATLSRSNFAHDYVPPRTLDTISSGSGF
jgi:hypothetical protein